LRLRVCRLGATNCVRPRRFVSPVSGNVRGFVRLCGDDARKRFCLSGGQGLRTVGMVTGDGGEGGGEAPLFAHRCAAVCLYATPAENEWRYLALVLPAVDDCLSFTPRETPFVHCVLGYILDTQPTLTVVEASETVLSLVIEGTPYCVR